MGGGRGECRVGVATSEGLRDERQRQAAGIDSSTPVVVLLDRYSASASEVLAGWVCYDVCLSVCLSVHLSVCLSACLSVTRARKMAAQ